MMEKTDKLKNIAFELETIIVESSIETEKAKVVNETALTGYFHSLIPDKVSKNCNDNTLIITGFDNNRVFTEIAYESAVRATGLLKKASALVNELIELAHSRQ